MYLGLKYITIKQKDSISQERIAKNGNPNSAQDISKLG